VVIHCRVGLSRFGSINSRAITKIRQLSSWISGTPVVKDVLLEGEVAFVDDLSRITWIFKIMFMEGLITVLHCLNLVWEGIFACNALTLTSSH
jgi:hypothetical protein